MNIRRYLVSTTERCHRWCNFTRPPMLIYSPVWFICRTNWKINILIGQITCQLNSWQRVNWGPVTLQFSIHWILFIGIQMRENGYLDQRRHARSKWILNAVSKWQNISKYFFLYLIQSHRCDWIIQCGTASDAKFKSVFVLWLALRDTDPDTALHYNQSHTMLLSLWRQWPIRDVQMNHHWNAVFCSLDRLRM